MSPNDPVPPVNPANSAGAGVATAVDPNDLIGPSGFGIQRFVSSGNLLSYRINFENDKNASAPAQQVEISNPLSEALDGSTFELTEICFGNHFIAVPPETQHFEKTEKMAYNGVTFTVQIEAGIHPDTGEVYARFTSIDPITGLSPAVDIGFLPPEDGTGRGQGHMSYFIKPKAGLATSTEIRNIAEIVFDGQAAIATNQVDPHDPSKGTDPEKEAPVTIDAGAPVSSVVTLPEVSATTHITVSWSGDDDGAGVATYDVYASVNDGTFQPWLKSTTSTSAVYIAQPGQQLAFYCVARDNVGNEESAPVTAQAQTSAITPDGGYNATSELWLKAVLEIPGAPVTLVWKEVATDITPSGDQVISGYFYANPNDFADGSQYNPEAFVEIYISTNGWCNIAFNNVASNHAAVDSVTVYSAHQYTGVAQQTGTTTSTQRLVEHQYTDVTIQSTVPVEGTLPPSSIDAGYNLTAGLWGKAVLEVPGSPVALIWKWVGTDITPSGDKVAVGYFYADPGDVAYGSEFNPEVFVKIYIDTSGWGYIAFNHATVDNVTVFSAHQYAGVADQTGTVTLATKLVEHPYDGVSINDGSVSRLPDTGQTTSSTDTYGEDADYNINPPSYTKLDATGAALADSAINWAMIKDNVTGLIWENKTDDGGIHDKDDTYAWQTAKDDFIAQLNTANFGGRSDWRLPTAKELTTIVDRGRHSPSIHMGYFTKTMSFGYWSSTTGAGHSDSAWSVHFNYGGVYGRNKSVTLYVRAVCGEPSGVFADAIISERMVDNGDQTLSDTATGLMWQKAEAGAKTWEAALTYCETLQLAGYDDWRLPNATELQSLVDYLHNDPAIDTVAFPGAVSTSYWSSTSLDSYPLAAWSVHFDYGLVCYYGKAHSLKVRAVRGGQ